MYSGIVKHCKKWVNELSILRILQLYCVIVQCCCSLLLYMLLYYVIATHLRRQICWQKQPTKEHQHKHRLQYNIMSRITSQRQDIMLPAIASHGMLGKIRFYNNTAFLSRSNLLPWTLRSIYDVDIRILPAA